VTLLRNGSFDAAAAGFRRALELSPNFVLARYNLACTLARANALDDAERELRAVFELDWIGFRAHAAEDSDLATFHHSVQGKRLAARTPELEARYRASLDRGLRAMIWLTRTADPTQPSGLRVGVWDHVTKRFVATSERRAGAFAAYISSDLPYAVLVTGDIPRMLGGDMADHFSVKDVTYWPFDTSGKPIATILVGKAALSGAVRFADDESVLTMHSAV